MRRRETLKEKPEQEASPWQRAILVGIAAVGLTTACSDQEPVAASRAPESVVITTQHDPSREFSQAPAWEQDFSRLPDGKLDPSVWRYDLNPDVPGYNDEAQGYTSNPRNVRVEDGKLVLEAHREPYVYPDDPQKRTYEITSGRIDTLNSFQFEYGKIEATIKLPEGEGTWPAFWLLSASNVHTNKLHPSDADWAEPRFYLHDGELDIMEYYGGQPGVIEATVHTFNRSHEGHAKLTDATDRFHTYGVEITPHKLVWTIDGTPYYEFTKTSDSPDDWPFGNGNELYVILNLAMGGEGGGEVNPSQNAWRMEIENVKFYEYVK